MDTDDLSIDAYDAILRKAEMFHHDLTLQFGVLTSFCENENEYLEKALLTIINWESNIESATCAIFFDNIHISHNYREGHIPIPFLNFIYF